MRGCHTRARNLPINSHAMALAGGFEGESRSMPESLLAPLSVTLRLEGRVARLEAADLAADAGSFTATHSHQSAL